MKGQQGRFQVMHDLGSGCVVQESGNRPQQRRDVERNERGLPAGRDAKAADPRLYAGRSGKQTMHSERTARRQSAHEPFCRGFVFYERRFTGLGRGRLRWRLDGFQQRGEFEFAQQVG